MKTVPREEYVAFVRNLPRSLTECEEGAGTMSAAITYDENGAPRAKATYCRPVQMTGVKTIVTYYVDAE
jgi:hypothetical protein